MPPKSLDTKLETLQSDNSSDCFILADAKDADMAFGLSACGERWPQQPGESTYRSLQEYEAIIRGIVEQGLVDIMLVSARTADRLARIERLFDGTAVTPAIRSNDTTDIWLAGKDYSYASEPSLPFATASIPHALYGAIAPAEDSAKCVDLGLYSMTLNHDVASDRASLLAYREFRHEAERAGFRHFLEVFPPNAPHDLKQKEYAPFIADSIVRLLAGVTESERPQFLKIPYLGRRLTSALCEFDNTMVVGIMGGSSGTTHDAFHLLAEARKSGVRAALFGRKINRAEDQLLFIQHLRWVADAETSASEAVRSYHSELQKQGIQPRLALDDDLQLTSASEGLADSNSADELASYSSSNPIAEKVAQ